MNLWRQKTPVVAVLFLLLSNAWCEAVPGAGTRLHYIVLSGRNDAAPPFASVDFVYGPAEGGRNFRWWQLEVRAGTNHDTPPMFLVRALTSANPLEQRQQSIQFSRYQLKIPETGEAYEYSDTNTGRALLPEWGGFERDFLPHAASGSGWINDVPETCRYLGQVLSLASVSSAGNWSPWNDVKHLALNPEILVGNDRDFKDSEGHRLATSTTNDYKYIPLTENDYRTAIDTGMNVFPVAAAHENRVRSQPVYYLREATGTPALRYPADLYRANFLGPVMLVDEPASLILDDDHARREGRSASDFAALFETRTRATLWSDGSYGVWRLESELRRLGVNLGDMRLNQINIPAWDSYPEATYYEMKAGVCGLVQEGRYNVDSFNYWVAADTGLKLRFTASQLLKFNFALMRGPARPFRKFWGTSIYGQCDPALAPLALTTAYDMGARYFWFWTSDHAHHLPWNEQMSLSRILKKYAASHPRQSIFAPPPKRDAVIAIPDGYFLSLRDFYWNAGSNTARREAGESYRRVLARSMQAVQQCFERGEDFNITVDDGHALKGYRRVIKIDDKLDR